mgnify:CR=1 FL=1
MNFLSDIQRAHSRRWFLKDCGLGLGAIALTSLEARANANPGNPNPLAPKRPHFPAKAKNVIFLYMGGAPSHLDLFDYKPELTKLFKKIL